MKNVQKFTLKNGVRVLVEPVDYVQSVAIGLTCKTGSRHELPHEAGITHVIEHMVFKGTPNRTAKQIAEEIESRGGSLNAFTDKEMTCYYCRMLADDAPVGVDVLTDIVLNPLFEQEELEREKGVILEEIKRYHDDPSEYVHELHYSERWGNHPLGKPIIGTEESVKSFSVDDLRCYMQRQYKAENVVLSVAGNVDPVAFKECAEEKLSKFEPGATTKNLDAPVGKRLKKELGEDTEQVHFCIGSDAPSLFDTEDMFSTLVMGSILGGGMSSRLFQEIREKRGLVYSIGSYMLNYEAGGAFTVTGGTSDEAWPLVQKLVREEFDKLINGEIENDEIEKIKSNICGQLVLSLEGMSAQMMRATRHELHYNKTIPVEESLANVRAVSKDRIVDIANRLLTPDKINTTAIGPF